MDKSESNFAEETICLKSRKCSRWVFTAVFLFVMILVLAGYWIWSNYYSPNAIIGQNIRKYEKGMKQIEETLKADTYGGKTPEETLSMFIDALKKEDIELASKYIYQGLGASDGKNREEYKEALEQVKKEGKLQELVNLLSKAKPTGVSINDKYYSGFEIRDDNGEYVGGIGMFRHQYSTVWKIQSL